MGSDLDLLDMMKTKALLANFFMCTIAAASTGGAGDMELLLVQAEYHDALTSGSSAIRESNSNNNKYVGHYLYFGNSQHCYHGSKSDGSIIWRHGDRSPTKTFPKDPFQERNWTFGGGGFGQLSPLGMKQHMDLGKLIRKTYVDDMKFLSARYSSEEIYIRSTDTNRTIISAISNLLGMYGPNDGKAIPGIDYPAVEGWPPGLVPIAIHTVDDDTDYVANTDAYCYRREVLWAMAKNSSMLRAYQNVNAGLFANLTRLSGQFVTVDNFWVVRDALQIEQIHANETLRVVNTWFNDDLFKRMTTVQSQLDAYKNGVFNKTIIINGLDIGSEIQKLRGGSIFNEIMMHMNMKMKCLNVIHKGCKWMNGLKYYAYSAHDSTIYAIFAILGIQDKVIHPNGYPVYSAAAFFELWRNRTDNKPYFKMMYHQNDENVTFYPITQFIDLCEGRLFCSLKIFKAFANKTKPDLPIAQWCNVNPLSQASSASSWAVMAVGALC